MKGSHHIIIQNNRVRFEFDIKRNTTIIRGDSATGKSTLVSFIRERMNLGDSSGINISSDKALSVLEGPRWKTILKDIHDEIVFIDEENGFIKSKDFADAIKETDNYYVLVTRENLKNLPYSVEEIYGIHSSGKFHDLKRVMNSFYRLYSIEKISSKVRPEEVITEDLNSGFEFFENILREHGIPCKSAKGKSNIIKCLSDCTDKNTVVFADGAAIGSEMTELYQAIKVDKNIILYLPESFEWLILKSGLIDGNEVKEMLKAPEEYIESSEYFSWERFFTAMLIKFSKGTYLQYAKSKLNKNYLNEKERQKIIDVLGDAIDLE